MASSRATLFATFESALDFYEYCKQGKSTSAHSSSQRDEKQRGGYEFFGTRDFNHAVTLATTGWAEGVKQASALASRLSADLLATLSRPEVVYDLTGDCFDMGKVLTGEPEAWLHFEQGEEDASTIAPAKVHIVLNASVSAGISTEQITLRGCAVMALALVLQAANRPTKISIVCPLSDDGRHMQFAVTLKDYFDTLQEDAIAFATMHPSFFRRFGFKWMEINGIQAFGYGTVAEPQGDFAKGDVYLGSAMYDTVPFKTEASTEKWVKATLEAHGVTFNRKEG